METTEIAADQGIVARRQVLYWRLLGAVFQVHKGASALDTMSATIAREVGLPEVVCDPMITIETLLQRYPELRPELEDLLGDEDQESATIDEASLRRGLLAAKMLLNIFGPAAQQPTMTACDYSAWTREVAGFKRAFHLDDSCSGRGGGGGRSTRGTAMGREITEGELLEGLEAMESDIVKRIALREVLEDHTLADKLTPSMSLVEQLLRDKHNLSDQALDNAKTLIRRYVEELGEALKLQVEQTPCAALDYSVPPKRVFRNLDLKRTIWRNLVNWDPDQERLYVDQLYFKHSAKQTTPTRIIVVVDQSGSMVDAMVHCTILASIFAGLPKVDVHLIAYDTQALDLSAWVGDPLEVLLRTNLGGGTNGMVAMDLAQPKIVAPRQTAMVWISDFYDNRDLMDIFRGLKQSGVHLIPVGSVNSSGYQSIDPWFASRFKELGTPILSGSIKHLIRDIKEFVATC